MIHCYTHVYLHKKTNASGLTTVLFLPSLLLISSLHRCVTCRQRARKGGFYLQLLNTRSLSLSLFPLDGVKRTQVGFFPSDPASLRDYFRWIYWSVGSQIKFCVCDWVCVRGTSTSHYVLIHFLREEKDVRFKMNVYALVCFSLFFGSSKIRFFSTVVLKNGGCIFLLFVR